MDLSRSKSGIFFHKHSINVMRRNDMRHAQNECSLCSFYGSTRILQSTQPVHQHVVNIFWSFAYETSSLIWKTAKRKSDGKVIESRIEKWPEAHCLKTYKIISALSAALESRIRPKTDSAFRTNNHFHPYTHSSPWPLILVAWAIGHVFVINNSTFIDDNSFDA